MATHSTVLAWKIPWTQEPGGLLCPWDFPGKDTGVGCHFLLQDLPNPGIEPTSPALSGEFFTTEPPGKPPVDCSVQSLSRVQLFATP